MAEKKHRYKLDAIIAKEQRLVKNQKRAAPKTAAVPKGDPTRQLLDQIIRKIGRSHAS